MPRKAKRSSFRALILLLAEPYCLNWCNAGELGHATPVLSFDYEYSNTEFVYSQIYSQRTFLWSHEEDIFMEFRPCRAECCGAERILLRSSHDAKRISET